MVAYAIFIRENITDPEEMKIYGQMAGPTIAAFDAKPLVAYGPIETVEGPEAQGVVVVQFNSMEEARSWYHGEGYQAALQHRLKGANYRAMLVQGV